MMERNKFITLDEMSGITADILSHTGYSLQWSGSIEAVPIEDIIDIDYGLEVKWGDLDHVSAEPVMAALYPRSRKIVLNSSFKDLFKEKYGTMMFSLAHEFGHWILHAEDKMSLQNTLFENDVFYCRSNVRKSRIEYQADLFAGCLLMPVEIITPLIQDMWNNAKLITWEQLYRIASEFQVSISALTTRLNQLNLVYIDSDSNIHQSREEAVGQQVLF